MTVDQQDIRLMINDALRPLLIKLTIEAATAIDVAQFCLAPLCTTTPASYREFFEAMQSAARRRVACRIILAAPVARNPQAGNSIMAAPQLAAHGWQIRWAPGSRLHHAKTWRFDDRIAVIGSHNLTEAALARNRETSVIINSRRLCAEMLAEFERLWQTSTPYG